MALGDYVLFRDGAIFFMDLSAEALPTILRICEEMPEVGEAMAAAFPEPPPAMTGGDPTTFHLTAALAAWMAEEPGTALPLLGCFTSPIDPFTTPDVDAEMRRKVREMIPRC
jgi:hypothetical protein